jgi:hypothetical protein
MNGILVSWIVQLAEAGVTEDNIAAIRPAYGSSPTTPPALVATASDPQAFLTNPFSSLTESVRPVSDQSLLFGVSTNLNLFATQKSRRKRTRE